MDFSYYYDFTGELAISMWKKSFLPDSKKMLWEGTVILPGEKEGTFPFVALWANHLNIHEINGRKIDPASRSLYVGNRYGRDCLELPLSSGENKINVVISVPDTWNEKEYGEYTFTMEFIPDFEKGEKTPPFQKKPPLIEPLTVKKAAWKEDLSGIPGAGRKMTPGRFGYTKGDGLLDYGISSFGLVDKMYLCGHPEHPAPYRWGYCVLPGEEAAHFTTESIKQYGDEIKINQLSASWKSQGVLLEYSLGSPGLYVTCPDKDMRLSQLEFAGSPQYIMTSDAITDLENFDPSSMKENFLLLFGAREYVEVPILILLDKKPEKLLLSYKGNRISSITFKGCHQMITSTPFGLEYLASATPEDTAFLRSALMRAKFWSKALLAFPFECKDYFHIDEKEQKCRITQEFTYKTFSNQWNTVPLRLAPYPPAAVLSGKGEFDPNVTNLHFSTKYGPLYAVEGEYSSYTLPLMPNDTGYVLEEEGGNAAERLKNKLKEYFDFQDHFPDDFRSYAYIGSSLERWGFAAMLAHFMPEEYRKQLAEKAGKSLINTCDPNSSYTCLLTDHSYLYKIEGHPHQEIIDYYYSPRMQRKEMKNFYRRKEPFTGVEYVICYLNVSLLRQNKNYTDQDISNSPNPYIENDWGLGISFYTLYTCALASGDFSQIRKHWNSLKKMYEYLDLYHDWACLSAGYAERGTTWCEGANYGAYSAFPYLAKIANDEEAYLYGKYLAAKQLALRMALYRSSQNYFCKCYKVPPFGITKAFREEEGPSLQFQGVPKELDFDRLRVGQLHTYLTEGAFPDLLRHYRRFLPEEHRDIMERYLAQMLDPERNKTKYFWGRQLTPTMILLDLADDPAYPQEKLFSYYEKAAAMDCLIQHCRDIGTFSTFQPEGLYPAMILAHFEARKHPVLLDSWEDLQIIKALHTKDGKVMISYLATGETPRLVCRLKNGAKVKTSTHVFEKNENLLIFHPDKKEGTIELIF